MANQSKLKAWVRYDGTGRVVTGGPIFQVNKPKVGNWKQIDANLCCNSGSTTTTTTNGAGGTPTAWVAYTSFNPTWSCQQINGTTRVLYTSVSTLTTGTILYTDAALTQPYNYLLSNYVAISNQVWQITSSSGAIQNPQSCASITTTSTTTTTTTQVVNNGIFRQSESSNGVCSTSSLIQLFWVGELTNYTQIFIDQARTQGYNTLGYVANTSTNARFSTSNGYAFNDGTCTTVDFTVTQLNNYGEYTPGVNINNFSGATTYNIGTTTFSTYEQAANDLNFSSSTEYTSFDYIQVGGFTYGETRYVAVRDATNHANKTVKSIVMTL